jgi:hypothetical protein
MGAQSLPKRGLQAAERHIDVSKALHMSGMLVPKFACCWAFVRAFGFSVGATSVARSHDPFSWERATEKNRSI